MRYNSGLAGLAHLVEQLICNHQVAGSSPAAGTKYNYKIKTFLKFGLTHTKVSGPKPDITYEFPRPCYFAW